jgi:hypothetical protein
MVKAIFSRKASGIEEIKERAGWTEYGAKPMDVFVERVVELSDEKWEHFKENLLEDYDFIKYAIKSMFVADGIWHCILVKSHTSEDGILVEAEGYEYARYSAYLTEVPE